MEFLNREAILNAHLHSNMDLLKSETLQNNGIQGLNLHSNMDLLK